MELSSIVQPFFWGARMVSVQQHKYTSFVYYFGAWNIGTWYTTNLYGELVVYHVLMLYVPNYFAKLTRLRLWTPTIRAPKKGLNTGFPRV